MPGELPFFGKSVKSVQLSHDFEIIRANSVEDSVPIFSETFNLSSACALAGASSEDVVEPAPVVVPEARRDGAREEVGFV